jgi:hypothetical protein
MYQADYIPSNDDPSEKMYWEGCGNTRGLISRIIPKFA